MSDRRPSRFYVTSVYAKRVIRWRRNSWPFLSVDAFADLSDVVMYPPKHRYREPSFQDIKDAQTIFCPSDRLEEFLIEYQGRINPVVIISGNSDHEFNDIPKNLPNSVRALFLQNSFVSDGEKIFTLPIGVENFRLGVNGNPKLFPFSQIPDQARGKLLLGPFSNTHITRVKLQEELKELPENLLFLKDRISPSKYRNLIENQFEFVACVRGNGIDTHRLWESLYRGRKPIVARDKWSDSLTYLDKHICKVDGWSKDELLHAIKHECRDFNPREVPELWMQYWAKLIKSFLV